MTLEFARRIEAAREALGAIVSGDFAEHRQEMEVVMDAILELGAASELDGAVTGQEPAVSFFRELSENLPLVLLVLDRYVYRISWMLSTSWEDREWIEVCSRRSAIEFFRKLLAVAASEESLNTTGIDEQIRERGKTEAYVPDSERIPGIPRSHWWWWL
jgi:hypothetical protein